MFVFAFLGNYFTEYFSTKCCTCSTASKRAGTRTRSRFFLYHADRSAYLLELRDADQQASAAVTESSLPAGRA